MSAEDLEKYETEMELTLYREYRDVVGIFKYVVETDRRFYLCNQVDVKARTEQGDVFFEVSMSDAWVWDMYRPARFAKNVKVLTFKDVNVEELQASDFDDRIAELDRDTTYVVYCRSGNRSADAAERMREAGLTVVDGGSLEDMAAAGYPMD